MTAGVPFPFQSPNTSREQVPHLVEFVLTACPELDPDNHRRHQRPCENGSMRQQAGPTSGLARNV
jgi:hypothetical protein